MQKYNLDKQHANGKMHAIERIRYLLDADSFSEIGSNVSNMIRGNEDNRKFPYDGVITGYGAIEGQKVFIYAQDVTINGGTLGLNHGKKISHLIELAIKQKCPLIGINDSGGARIQEGVNSLAGYGEIFYYNTLASGFIPQISIIAGTCAGGAVYTPGITDFVFVIENISQMFVTGPKVVKSVIGQECTMEELGGASIHAYRSGVAHFYHHNERACFDEVRKLVVLLADTTQRSYLSNNSYPYIEKAGCTGFKIPESSRKVYDIKNVIKEILDENSFIEVQKDFAKNLVVGYGKLCNITVGIVASQPSCLGGVLDCDSSDKGARFVRFCDAFEIPLITLVDVPGFMPGIEQEQNGIIRHGAKLLYAYAEASTIKLTLILRKAYGGAYIAMCSKHLRADFVYALSNAEIAVMGAEGAVPIIYNSKIKELDEAGRELFIKEMEEKYKTEFLNIYDALAAGYVDEIVELSEVRERFYKDIFILSNKRELITLNKKHGCIPL